MKNFHQRGVAAVELLIVIAVLGIIFFVVLPQFSKARELQTLKNAVNDILFSLDKARSQTLSSLNASEYGVHFQFDGVIIFKGANFSSLAEDNETINITSPATISDIAISGGGADIYFNRLSGAPSVTGAVTVSTPSFSKIITVSAVGVASVN